MIRYIYRDDNINRLYVVRADKVLFFNETELIHYLNNLFAKPMVDRIFYLFETNTYVGFSLH